MEAYETLPSPSHVLLTPASLQASFTTIHNNDYHHHHHEPPSSHFLLLSTSSIITNLLLHTTDSLLYTPILVQPPLQPAATTTTTTPLFSPRTPPSKVHLFPLTLLPPFSPFLCHSSTSISHEVYFPDGSSEVSIPRD